MQSPLPQICVAQILVYLGQKFWYQFVGHLTQINMYATIGV